MVTKYLYDTTDVCGLNGYNESSAFEENQFQQSFTRCTLIDIKVVSQNTALYHIYEKKFLEIFLVAINLENYIKNSLRCTLATELGK